MLTDLTRRRQVLREQVNADFEQLRSAVDTLGEAVQDRTDIGRVVHRHPYVWLGCALLIGFAWGVRHIPLKNN